MCQHDTGWAPEPVWTQGLEEKSSASAGDLTPVVQSVVSHYTDWATAALTTLQPEVISVTHIYISYNHFVKIIKLVWTGLKKLRPFGTIATSQNFNWSFTRYFLLGCFPSHDCEQVMLIGHVIYGTIITLIHRQAQDATCNATAYITDILVRYIQINKIRSLC
jgi:hypothetical protein